MLAWQWWRHLHIDNSNNTIVTRATIVIATIGRRLHIDANDASLTTSNEGNNINDDNDAIAKRATMLAWGGRQCHHNKGNNTTADQGRQHHCYKGNNASLTTAKTPAHQQR
jgi:hypothetical protein